MEPQQLPTKNPEQQTSVFSRLAALRLLRENMFYENPTRYALTDVAEDLPGPARAVGAYMKNVLPSYAIISDDPEQRKVQIDKAIARIKASQGSKQDLAKEVWKNVKEMSVGSALPATGLSLLYNLLGPRWIRGNKLVKGVPTKVFRSPVRLGQNLRNLVTRKNFAANMARRTFNDTLTGVGLSALTGAIYPVFAHYSAVSDKALNEARKVMEEQPYVTSLPASEILSVVKADKEDNENPVAAKLKNVGLGAGIGAGTGVVGGALPLVFEAAKALITRRGGGSLAKLRPLLIRHLRQAKGNALFGALLGGLSGATTKNLVDEEYGNIKQQQQPQMPTNVNLQHVNETQPIQTTYQAQPSRVVL